MRSRLVAVALTVASAILCAPGDALGAPAIAADPITGTNWTITPTPGGKFDILLTTTVVTQPTTFTIIGAPTDQLGVVEISASVPQFVFVEIRGSAGGTVASVDLIDSGASTSTVLLKDCKTSGDVGTITLNTIQAMNIGGNITGGINLVERSGGGASTLISGLVAGRILGDVIVEHGEIINLTAAQGLGQAGSPIQVRTFSGISQLDAAEIHADINTRANSGYGAIGHIQTTTGDFVGSIDTLRIEQVFSGDPGFLQIAGDLDADINVFEFIDNGNGASPEIQVGGSFMPGRTISMGSSLMPDAEISVGQAGGLGGQVVVNNFGGAGVWQGTVRVGGSLLVPTPNYNATSATIGGGAVGLVPFTVHSSDSFPTGGQILVEATAPTLANPLLVRHYGPVFFNTGEIPIVIERTPIGESNWTDITSCFLIGREATPQPNPTIIAAFPLDPVKGGFTYRVRPVRTGFASLFCDTPVANKPLVADYSHSFTVFGGCSGDANGDSTVNFADITAVLSNWGLSDTCSQDGDANGDGSVSFADVTSVLAAWGANCS